MKARPIDSGNRLLAACTLAVALCAGTAAGAQSPQCAVPYGAMVKLFDKPFHMNMVDSAGTDARLHGGKPTVSEEIFVGGTVYVFVRGKWVKSAVDVVEMRKDATLKIAADKSTCTHLRDESLNGESASVWSIHSASEDGPSDSQLWISKSRSVVLRSEIRMDVGGAMGKSHMISSYDYSNVQAPTGVK